MRLAPLLSAAMLVFATASSGFAGTPTPQVSPPEAAAPAHLSAPGAGKAGANKMTTLVISNARTVALTGLSVTDSEGKAIATLKKPLEPGRKTSLRLPAKAGCSFAVNASFADEAELEETQVDLCADKNLRFTEWARD